jgi:DNA-binding SARP family transcriptional activator
VDVTNDRYEQSVALKPWDYGGPEHVNHAPYVAIVDADGVLVDIEHELDGRFALGEAFPSHNGEDREVPPLESVAISADSTRRALLVHPRTEPGDVLVRVRTLGCTDVEDDEACGRWLGRRPGGLLKYLICQRYRVVHAQDIAEALWGHVGFVSSGTVRQCVHELREKVEAGRRDAPAQLVVTRQSGYALSRRVVVDADDFAVHVRRGIGAMGRGQHEIAIVHLRLAVAMYRGDFMSDEPQADWAHAERERLREHMEDGLGALARLYKAAGDARTATSCLHRLAEMRPLDVDAHRRLIATLLSQGRHSHASRCYRAFCGRLWRELSRVPDFTLTDLTPEGATARGRAASPPPAARSST